MSSQSLNLQIDCLDPQPYLFGYLDPQTCLDVSSRSINLEITHLGSQTYSIVLFRALNLILSII